MTTIKNIFKQKEINYDKKTLLSFLGSIGIGYAMLTGITITQQAIVYLVALVFMSWLCAMVGYDKVIQTISQFKTTAKDD